MPQHSLATGSELHYPMGHSSSGVALDLIANTANAYRVRDAGRSLRDVFNISSQTSTPSITLGNNTDAFALDLQGDLTVGSGTTARDVTFFVTDNDASAFRVLSGDATLMLAFDTTNSAEQILFGADDVTANTNFIFRGEGALRVTSLNNTERDAVNSIVDGMIVYSTTDSQLQGRVAGAWVNLGAAAGGGHSFDAAYDGGVSVTMDGGAIDLNRTTGVPSVLDIDITGTITSGGTAVSIDYGTGAWTGQANGISLNYGGMSSLTVAAPVYGLQLTGITNADASNNSIGASIAGFDHAMEISGSAGFGSVGAATHDVTIGAASVPAVVSIHGEGASDAIDVMLHRHATGGAFAPRISGARSRGDEATPTVVGSGDVLLRLEGLGYDGTDYEVGAEIRLSVDATPGAGDMPGRIELWTTPNGTATPVERLRIAEDGAWGLAGANYGTSGQVITSNGISAAPTWQDAGGASDLQGAYDGGNTITTSGGAVAVTQESLAGLTNPAISVAYPTFSYTGAATPNGITVDMTGATITSSASVYGVNLTGVANGGAGSSYGLNISGFDISAEFATGISFSTTPFWIGGGSHGTVGTNGVVIGNATTGTGTSPTVVGTNATCSGNSAAAYGFSADAGGTGALAVGFQASTAAGCSFATAIGGNSIVNASATAGIAIGYQANVGSGDTYSIAMGYQALTTAANQWVVGSTTGYITDIMFGSDTTEATQRTVDLHVPGGTATADGWNLTLRAGDGGVTSGNGGNVTMAAGTVTSGTAGVAFITNETSTLSVADQSLTWTDDGTTGTPVWALRMRTEDVTMDSGTSTQDTTITFPAGSVGFGVAVRVIDVVTGCTSFDVGIAGATQRFITGHGVADATAPEVGPSVDVYTGDVVRMTAVGGSAIFSTGTVRVCLYYYVMEAPDTD